MGSLVVVVSDPQPDPFPRCFKAIERRAGQKLLPDRRPKPLHFSQRHRMLRPALDVGHPVLLQLGLEPARPPPRRVLPPVVGQHFLRWLIFAHGDPIDLDHCRRRGTAEQVRSHHVTGVIVQERDEVRVLPSQPEGEDVGLPHLVWGRPLEEPGPGQVAPPLRSLIVHQPGFMQPGANGFRAARQPKHPPQDLGDPLHAPTRFRFFEFQDAGRHRLAQLVLPRPWSPSLRPKAILAFFPIRFDPVRDRAFAHPKFPADDIPTDAFFQVQLHRLEPELIRIHQLRPFFRAVLTGLLWPNFDLLFHHNTPLPSLECYPFLTRHRPHQLLGRTYPLCSR